MGDTIALLANGMDHLINAGLLERPTDSSNTTINRLMSSALIHLPLAMFNYAVDKWLFDFYTGEISNDELNKHWWYLVNKYQV